jgi:hypothetical protein
LKENFPFVNLGMRVFCLIIFAFFLLGSPGKVNAQDTLKSRYGPSDTIRVQAILYDGEYIPYSELPEVFISNVSARKLAQIMQEYNRLRNAVYVTYPYATKAGVVINDVNEHLKNVTDKNQRKKYIKTRESDLKKQFSDPLSNLSVYQGRVLMKLINRETGNDCYELIKEYRGGMNARMYQTVAFLFGSDLKQSFDPVNNSVDRQIESFVREIRGGWYTSPAIR